MTASSVLDVPFRASVVSPGSPGGGDAAPVADPHRPVRDVPDLVRHVGAIVPTAVRRQLWTLFFDSDDIALPLMVPLEAVPATPDVAAIEHYGDALGAVAAEFGAASVAFVLERPGPAASSASDGRWAEALTALARHRVFEVRPVLLCSDAGVSVLDEASGRSGRSGRGDLPQASSSPVRLADIVRLP
jgi:hypothetical protein